MKKLISIFMVMCMVLTTIGTVVSAEEPQIESVATETRELVNASITAFKPVIDEIVKLYGEDNGYYVLTDATDAANPVYTAMTSGSSAPLNTGNVPATPYSSAIYKKNDDGTYTQVVDAYQGLQGETGFRNITMYAPGTVKNTTYQTNGIGLRDSYMRINRNALNYEFPNINFITSPITSGKVEYGFDFVLKSGKWGTPNTSSNAGGVGEIKDSSIYGENVNGGHNVDDKIVRARFDATYGFAIYNKNLTTEDKWDTLIAKASVEDDKTISVVYNLDLASKTFDITVVYDGGEPVTRTNVPFCTDNYKAIDAIEFNGMDDTDACPSSFYQVSKVYMKELLPDTITGDYNGKGSENVLTEGKSITIENGAILRNAIIDATLGNVVIGETTVKGNMTFNEEGQLDVAENGTLNLKKAGDKENTYHWGLIKKVELSEVTSPYLVPLTASNGYTYDASFNLGTEGTFTGTARLLIGVQNVPEGVEITVE